MKIKYKEIKTVFTFPDGRTNEATFCLHIDPNHEANDSISSAMGEYNQKQFALGAIKAVTTARFV